MGSIIGGIACGMGGGIELLLKQRHSLGEFPEAEYVGTHGFHVGLHQDIEPEHIEYFMDTLDEFLTTKSVG